MNARYQILENVRKNQPQATGIPDILTWKPEQRTQSSLSETFITIAHNIGSKVIRVNDMNEIKGHLQHTLNNGLRVVSMVPQLADICDCLDCNGTLPHHLEDVEVAILQAVFGVAENSAIWITEKQMGIRVLPFICQHLVMILNTQDIVADMHAAYERTANDDYGFATFIAGPSKTADIEQSLVLGAHGARSLTIYLLSDNL